MNFLLVFSVENNIINIIYIIKIVENYYRFTNPTFKYLIFNIQARFGWRKNSFTQLGCQTNYINYIYFSCSRFIDVRGRLLSRFGHAWV